jgi:signal transduction histidine kinase
VSTRVLPITDAARDGPEWLLTLHRLSRSVTASVDLDAALSAIVDAAHQLTGAASTAILLLEPDAHLVMRVGHGPVLANIADRALHEQRTIQVEDALAAPLVWRGESLGVLTMGALQPFALDADHTQLASELAEMAAAAVANARTYDTLRRTQQRLLETEQLSAMGHLAHGIAHELNTPLGVLISNMSVLEQYADALTRIATSTQAAITHLRLAGDPRQIATDLEAGLKAAELEYLAEDLPALASESGESARQLAGIVRSVALVAGGGPDKQTPVAVEEALEAAITLAWNEIKQRGGLVRAYTAVPPVMGTSTDLTRLFVHLLLNAAQALDERSGTIHVSLNADGDGIAARISDTGRGISTAHLARVFDSAPGGGVGLAVCQGIVRRLGGTIAIDSQFGTGTTVTVRLPRAPGA